jgi:hypothetical protein
MYRLRLHFGGTPVYAPRPTERDVQLIFAAPSRAQQRAMMCTSALFLLSLVWVR